MVNENQFDPEKELWPRAPFTPAVHPTARKAVRNPDGTVEPSKQQRAEIATGIPGGDLGSLRVKDGIWEMFAGVWRPFDPSRPSELHYANMAHRYGYWSFGDPRSDDSQTYIHSWEVIEKEEARLAGREPRPFPSETMEHYDLIYHPTLRDDLFRRALILEPPTDRTDPPTVEPPKPPIHPPIEFGAVAALQAIKNIAETESASIPTSGGGRPINDARKAFRRVLDRIKEEAKKGGALLLLLCLLPLSGCGTLGAVKPPVLAGHADGPLQRIWVALISRATLGDEAFEGASVESIDSGDVAAGLVTGAIQSRFGDLAPLVGELVGQRLIEKAGPRAWSVKVVGDPADAPPRWFFVRQSAGAGKVAALLPNTPVKIYAKRYEVPGFSALIVTRWAEK